MTTTSTERMVSPGIVVDRNRLSGAPCIYGRRISAASVVDLALAGGRETLREEYDLTDNQIDDALRWDHEGRPG